MSEDKINRSSNRIIRNRSIDSEFVGFGDHATVGYLKQADFDDHINDATIHFTQAEISITVSQISDYDTQGFVPASGGEFTGNIIVPNATQGTHALNRDTGDTLYAPLSSIYSHWRLQVDTGIDEQINSGTIVNIVGGNSIDLTYDLSGDPTITIDSTAAETNNFLTNVIFGGTIGDDVIVTYERTGLLDIDFDMTDHLDARYSLISHGHVLASSGNAGFMSAANFDKLATIATGADDYDHWKLQVDGGIHEEINSGQSVDFVGGTDIDLVLDLTNDPVITINWAGTNTNNFLNGVTFAGTIGDDIIVRYSRSGLSDIDHNMTAHMEAYFDTVYASLGHSHSHFTATNNPHSVTKAQVGLSNVTNDAQVPASGGTFTGNVRLGTNDNIIFNDNGALIFENVGSGNTATPYLVARSGTGTTNNIIMRMGTDGVDFPKEVSIQGGLILPSVFP